MRSNDGLVTPDQVAQAKRNLPPPTLYIVIAGGNHARFGYYGSQQGDNAASISREDQQKQIVQAMVKLLQAIQPQMFVPVRGNSRGSALPHEKRL